MNDDNILRYLEFMSKTHRQQLNERQKYEWKVVFTTISFYILAVLAVYGGKIPIPPNPFVFKLLIWIVFVAVAIITILYLANVSMANNKNKIIAEDHEDALTSMLKNQSAAGTSLTYDFDDEEYRRKARYWCSWSGFCIGKGKWAWFWQLAAVLLFAITSALLLSLADRC